MAYADTPVVDWSQTWTPGARSTNWAEFVRIDPNGDVLTVGSYGIADIAVQKRSASGTLLWTVVQDFDLRDDRVEGVGMDAAGNLTICGRSDVGGFNSRWILLKVNNTGSVAWSQIPVAGEARGIAVAADGSFVVTGFGPSGSNAFDLVTMKYSADGTRLWSNRYNGPVSGDDYGEDVAIAGDGSIYVTGSAQRNAMQRDMRVMKFTSAGVRQWVRAYAGPTDWSAEGIKVMVYPDGGCIVAGQQTMGNQVTKFDAFFSRYGADGTAMWRRIFDGPAGMVDRVKDMKIDAVGNIWAVNASMMSDFVDDIMLVRYTPTGVRESRRFSGGAGHSDEPTGLAIHPTSGLVYICGVSTNSYNEAASVVLKYNTLTKRWVHMSYGPHMGEAAMGVAMDAQNRAVVVGMQKADTGADALIFCIR